MARVQVDYRTLLEDRYSRYHSPDRRLYTRAEASAIHDRNPRATFWEYKAQLPVLPVQPLTAQATRALEKWLPF
jgi:hypothetical protein